MLHISWCDEEGDEECAMTDAIGSTELAQMFVKAAEEIRRKHQYLSELDSVAGDGDHGTTMLRVVERLEATGAANTPENLRVRLREVGWSVMGVRRRRLQRTSRNIFRRDGRCGNWGLLHELHGRCQSIRGRSPRRFKTHEGSTGR